MTRQILRILALAILISGCSTIGGDADVESGSTYAEQGDLRKAEKKLKEAINKNLIKYSKQEVYTMIGNIYNELEEFDSSILYHKKALQIDSNYVDALVNLGIVYRLTSRIELAEECYARAKLLNPKDPEVYASLGALYVVKGNIPLAIENLEHSIELNPQLAIAHSNYAMALAMTGNYVKADLELKQAVALGYKNGEVLRKRIENLKQIDK